MTTDSEVLTAQAVSGWLFPYLLALDIYVWFQASPHPQDAKAVQEWLRYPVRRHFNWYDEAWLMLVKWLLWGFGYTGMGVEREIERIPDDVKIQWYRQVNLANLLNSPCDWSAFVLQGGLRDDKRKRSPWSRSTGFYSTPLNVCSLMTRMTMGMDDDKLTDTRVLTVLDACVGTGSMLLPMSNYSLRLSGQEIVGDLCLCSILNGFLWMPWLILMPDRTRAMLQEHADQINRYRVMRDLLVRPDQLPQISGNDGASNGIIKTNDPQTVALAEQRRESADAFYEAARRGELEPMSF